MNNLFESLVDSIKEDNDLEFTRQMWNNRAEEFSNIMLPKGDITLNMLESKIDFKDKTILDIGFGAGRYLTYFAEKNADIYGVELSENMIDFAVKALKKGRYKFKRDNLLNSSWEDINIDKMNWENKFDLVFLSMSPAISSYEELEKVLKASKRFVFISAHVEREDTLFSEIAEEFSVNLDTQSIGKIVPLFNLLYNMGYFPEIKFSKFERESLVEIKDVLKRYTYWIFGDEYDEENLKSVEASLKYREVDGKLRTTVKTVNGYMLLEK